MAITPQSIRDKEFQVKMRGYDKFEVRMYLEYVAEEYLGFLERLEKLEKYGKNQDQAHKELQQEWQSSKQEFIETQSKIKTLKDECQQEKERYEKQKQESENQKRALEQLEEEKRALAREKDNANSRIAEMKSVVAQEMSKNENLLQRISFLEKQIKLVRKDDDELKRTLAAAQRFSEETIKKSEQEASDIFNRARSEIEKLRNEAKDELAYYPREIKRVKGEYNKVKERLRAIIMQYLASLEDDSTSSVEILEEAELKKDKQAENSVAIEQVLLQNKVLNNREYQSLTEEDGSHELFQSIPIPDDLSPVNDYLDEISNSFDLSLDSKDKRS